MGEQQEIPEVSYNKDYFFDIFGTKVLTKDIFKQYASKVDISTNEVIYDYNDPLSEIEKECFHVWHVEYNEDPNLDYTFSNYVYWDVPSSVIRCSRDERDQKCKLIELAFQTCKDIFPSEYYLKNSLSDLNAEISQIMSKWGDDRQEFCNTKEGEEIRLKELENYYNKRYLILKEYFSKMVVDKDKNPILWNYLNNK